MKYLTVKNWSEFQHYKDRHPPWIKLHRALLDDYEFARLQDASKAHLMLIWLFASSHDGRVPADPKFLQTKLGLDKQPDLEMFVDQGFLIAEQDASGVLAEGKQEDSDALGLARSREKRREEAEESNKRFEIFWSAYPKRVAKPDALKAWREAKIQNGDFDRVMSALEAFKASDEWRESKYIPHPAKWLNKRRFEDEISRPPATPDPTLGAI